MDLIGKQYLPEGSLYPQAEAPDDLNDIRTWRKDKCNINTRRVDLNEQIIFYNNRLRLTKLFNHFCLRVLLYTV